MKQLLAILAAVFLLVRPLCDAQAAGIMHDAPRGEAHAIAGHGGGGENSGGDSMCCADLKDGAVAKLTELAAARVAGEALFATPAATFAWHRVTAGDARRFPASAFIQTSFYARSARIRR